MLATIVVNGGPTEIHQILTFLLEFSSAQGKFGDGKIQIQIQLRTDKSESPVKYSSVGGRMPFADEPPAVPEPLIPPSKWADNAEVLWPRWRCRVCGKSRETGGGDHTICDASIKYALEHLVR